MQAHVCIPEGLATVLEVVLVLIIIVIHSGVHQAIWSVSGDGHDAPIIGNKQGI